MLNVNYYCTFYTFGIDININNYIQYNYPLNLILLVYICIQNYSATRFFNREPYNITYYSHTRSAQLQF